MRYRKLGQTDLKVSVLGFGCMRLPLQSKSTNPADIFAPNQPIDEEEALKMIHYALEAGINYFDTAYPYHSGQSERLVGRALEGKRQDVLLATKLPLWLLNSEADAERIFEEQLQKLKTSYLDVYLLHGLNRAMWDKTKQLNLLSFVDRLLADGKVRYAGFSFHDDLEIFKEIVDGYDWSLCQIQYNYYDENYQAGKEGLEYAAAKGLGVVIMEPLRGGKLAARVPEAIQRLWDQAEAKRSPAEWALRWVWNHPQVSTVLSGMSSMSQVEENVALAAAPVWVPLTDGELKLISRVTEIYKRRMKVDCTGCAYCMPCPEGVNIPFNLALYNDSFVFDELETPKMAYNVFLSPEQKASNCAECGECEEKCPQQLNVKEIMKEVHQRLGT
jgi:predicted aldo/keto reductase-like oxidoreductase